MTTRGGKAEPERAPATRTYRPALQPAHRSLPAVADRDRFAAAALAVDRLLKQLRRRAPSWQHYATSAAGLVSEAELGPN